MKFPDILNIHLHYKKLKNCTSQKKKININSPPKFPSDKTLMYALLHFFQTASCLTALAPPKKNSNLIKMQVHTYHHVHIVKK